MNNNQNGFDKPFETIAEFVDVMQRGCEAEFLWNGKHYGVGFGDENDERSIYIANDSTYAFNYPNAAALLDHEIDGEPLRNIITKVDVLVRTL